MKLKKIGDAMFYYRKLRGLTQEYVSEHLDVTAQYYAALENNRKRPSLNLLLDFCLQLNITPNQLLIETAYDTGSLTNEILNIFATHELTKKDQITIIKTLYVLANELSSPSDEEVLQIKNHKSTDTMWREKKED